jgi:hypothetical protein
LEVYGGVDAYNGPSKARSGGSGWQPPRNARFASLKRHSGSERSETSGFWRATRQESSTYSLSRASRTYLFVSHRTSWGILPQTPVFFLALLGVLSLLELDHCSVGDLDRFVSHHRTSRGSSPRRRARFAKSIPSYITP